MTLDFGNLLVLVVSVGLAFFIARFAASRWRSRHRGQSEQPLRDAESRQVRRARERREKEASNHRSR